MKKLLVLGMASVVLACAANAYPTLDGPTGTVTLPTASVVEAGTWNVAVDAVDVPFNSAYVGRGVYGITTGLEASAGVITDFNGRTAWSAGAKYAFPTNFACANWAVGAYYTDFSDTATHTLWGLEDKITAYVAGTRQFSDQFIGTAGLISRTFGYDGDDTTDVRPFASAQYFITDNLVAVGEVEFKKNDEFENVTNWALRYALTDNVAVQYGKVMAAPAYGIGIYEKFDTFGVNCVF